MKYKEMTKFLNDNGIFVMQPVIANEVDAQLEVEISDEEFEKICSEVYTTYLGVFYEIDIWDLVDTILVNKGYKG